MNPPASRPGDAEDEAQAVSAGDDVVADLVADALDAVAAAIHAEAMTGRATTAVSFLRAVASGRPALLFPAVPPTPAPAPTPPDDLDVLLGRLDAPRAPMRGRRAL